MYGEAQGEIRPVPYLLAMFRPLVWPGHGRASGRRAVRAGPELGAVRELLDRSHGVWGEQDVPAGAFEEKLKRLAFVGNN